MDPKYQPVSQASDEEVISPDFLHVENLQKQLRATRVIKLWAQLFGLLTIVLFFSNIYVMINSKKAVNLQDGLYPHIVPPSTPFSTFPNPQFPLTAFGDKAEILNNLLSAIADHRFRRKNRIRIPAIRGVGPGMGCAPPGMSTHTRFTHLPLA